MISALSPVVVACAADDFFSMPLAVTAFSALKNLSSDYRMVLYVLDGGVSSHNKAKLMRTLNAKRVEIHWIKPTSKQIEKVLLKGRASNHPISSYYRLLLPEIIPAHVNKVIYLDSDVVVEADLAKLWEQDLGENYLLAAQNQVDGILLNSWHLNHSVESLDLKQYGITPEDKYLNSGVLVINLEQWRQDNIADQVLNLIANHPDFPFPDQDGINIVLAGKWKELDPRWNQTHVVHSFTSPQETPYAPQLYFDLIHHPFIIHYTGRPKPWSKDCTHPQADRFFKYLDQTAWRGWRNNPFNFYFTLFRRSMRRLKIAVSRRISLFSDSFFVRN
ncbi:glycosyltransferase family 8 protein [Egbenema bharatensis]|uniref:glycosyltransferase family 8 protein n=1 Tax=Egbenema bharatensis TaxID=3463334 RepID=UPI003A8976D0